MFPPRASAARLLLFISWFCVCLCIAVPFENDLGIRAPIAGGYGLRVLPIGDSITRGSGDGDGGTAPRGGYRKSIYDKLAARGNTVEMVGSLSEGDFSDNKHEGHRGMNVSEIHSLSQEVGMSSKPNIALLHAGTNDLANRPNPNPQKSVVDLEALINDIIDRSPRVCVFVAALVPCKDDTQRVLIREYNELVKQLVQKLSGESKKVVLVDQYGLSRGKELKDNLHPNAKGYEKMAQQWYNAIIAADAKGWIKETETPVVKPTKAKTASATLSIREFLDSDGVEVA
ncbi:GDSL-like lipase/Acylhydrolase family protein [Sarocladium implicatum]|nr:GDSL-like lipase/Acylhydrolase family protein [Sarocladium implicatum]